MGQIPVQRFATLEAAQVYRCQRSGPHQAREGPITPRFEAARTSATAGAMDEPIGKFTGIDGNRRNRLNMGNFPIFKTIHRKGPET
jgi:hypothetical protein